MPNLEGFATEVFVGAIFSIIAFYCYESEMLIIAVPLGLCALGCIFLVLNSLYIYVLSFFTEKDS